MDKLIGLRLPQSRKIALRKVLEHRRKFCLRERVNYHDAFAFFLVWNSGHGKNLLAC